MQQMHENHPSYKIRINFPFTMSKQKHDAYSEQVWSESTAIGMIVTSTQFHSNTQNANFPFRLPKYLFKFSVVCITIGRLAIWMAAFVVHIISIKW